MALSPQDRAFYEEKLGWTGFLYLLGATVIVGAIIWPALLYIQDRSAGTASNWTPGIVGDLSVEGMLLGCIMSILMFLIARFYLWLGWLPRRR